MSPERVQEIAERLVRASSVSPDEEAETRCARVLESCLPAAIEHGAWPSADRRPIVWARVRGRTALTTVLLGHYDTVSARAYEALGDAALAFAPDALPEKLARHATTHEVSDTVRADLEEERARPGTWRFGRGMLDMKSGLAAGIAALEALAEPREPPAAGALLVATPDEEHVSLGMRSAVERLADLIGAGVEYSGVLNLDYALEPAVFLGVQGKLQIGIWVLGRAAHVADPTRGPDAISLGASLLAGLARAAALPAFTPMRFDDAKRGYSIEPATEARIELTVAWDGEPVAHVLERFREAIAAALTAGGAAGPVRVLTLPELEALARERGSTAPPSAMAPAAGDDGRTLTLDRLRGLAAAAGTTAPAAVLHLLPPVYPPSSARPSPFVRAAQAIAKAESLPVRGRYPFISDASYVAWRDRPEGELEPHLPALGDAYALPVAAARALDLDVVNAGPWGRDAHALFERVHAPYAFARLPRIVERIVRSVGDA